MDNCKQTERMRISKCTANDLDSLPLGMGYVPWQKLDSVYEPDCALQCGTIFPELYKPFCGKAGVSKCQ